MTAYIVSKTIKVGDGVSRKTFGVMDGSNTHVDGIGSKTYEDGIGSTGIATKTSENGDGYIVLSETKSTPPIDDTHFAVAMHATSSISRKVQSQAKCLEQLTMHATSLQVASANSRGSQIPQKSLEQLTKQPVGLSSNLLALIGSNPGDDIEDGSDIDSAHDPHSIEENQHLITGFVKCVESKMATLKSSSEASTSARDNSKETSSIPRGNPLPPSTKQVGKKKMKKLR